MIDELKERIRRRAQDIGLAFLGVCQAGPVTGFDHYVEWANAGLAGAMQWMSRDLQKRSDPRTLMPGCRTVLVAGMNYGTGNGPALKASVLTGTIARYARGSDYHEVLKDRLTCLLSAAEEEAEHSIEGRIYVDTGPLLERDLAFAAGLGWRAKNTHLIHPRLGSYFFLGEILVDLDLEPDSPQPGRCGTCSRCLDLCPTGAFLGPGVLDARRCISYLTIELRGPIPRELRPAIGSMVFGCDICQEVCPWNRRAPASDDPAYASRAGLDPVDLIRILGLTQAEFSLQFRGSAIKRTKRSGLLRNAAVALGNSRDCSAVPALVRALEDSEALVRGHAAWALGQIGGPSAILSLRHRLAIEPDLWVQDEITDALKEQTDTQEPAGGQPPVQGPLCNPTNL